MTGNVLPPYIPRMGEARHIIDVLTNDRDRARQSFFAHSNPGNLTPAGSRAWQIEHNALRDLLRAAQIRLDAETEMQQLLAWESVDG